MLYSTNRDNPFLFINLKLCGDWKHIMSKVEADPKTDEDVKLLKTAVSNTKNAMPKVV